MEAEEQNEVPVITSREIKTHKDLRALENGLTTLANFRLPANVKPSAFNALQLRILRAIGTYRSHFDALREAEQQIIDRYRNDPDSKLDRDNPETLHFGPKQLEYVQEMEDLLNQPVDVPASQVTFRVEDFNTAGLGVAAVVMEALGPLFIWPPLPPTGAPGA